MGPNAGGSTSDEAGGDARSGSEVRRQQAGFSIFLDQVADKRGRRHWETRLYHAESGVETTLAGVSPEHWIAWILERLDSPDIAGPDPRHDPRPAVVEVASVEILDVTVADEVEGGDDSLHTIRARVAIQLAGVARLEREIGSQVLRGIAHSRPRSTRGGPDRK